MRKHIDETEWTIHKVNGRAYEVMTCARTGEVVILGAPQSDDESHNCDAMGCGQDHVLWRGKAMRDEDGRIGDE